MCLAAFCRNHFVGLGEPELLNCVNATHFRSSNSQKISRPRRVAILYTTCGTALATASRQRRQAEDLSSNARLAQSALKSLGHAVLRVPFGRDVLELGTKLRAFRPDVVLNLAESPLSYYDMEPHAVAFLELLRIPYTGNGLLPLSLCKDKGLAKEVLVARGIATPRYCVCAQVPDRVPKLRFPLMVKPLRQDGSVGIDDTSVVDTLPALQRRVARVLKSQGHEALVEEFMGGREFHVAVLGNGDHAVPYQILPPSEYVYHSDRWRVCTFEAKWNERHPSYAAVEAVYPATISRVLYTALEKTAFACAAAFQLKGYARIDFRLDARGVPQVLEVNPNPDLVPGYGIARAAETGGWSYPALLEELLRCATARVLP